MGSVKFGEMTGRPQGHTAGRGGWRGAAEGRPLNNNHRYTSKTFPHPAAVFTRAFICSVNRSAAAKRLEDIISLLASVI